MTTNWTEVIKLAYDNKLSCHTHGSDLRVFLIGAPGIKARVCYANLRDKKFTDIQNIIGRILMISPKIPLDKAYEQLQSRPTF